MLTTPRRAALTGKLGPAEKSKKCEREAQKVGPAAIRHEKVGDSVIPEAESATLMPPLSS